MKKQLATLVLSLGLITGSGVSLADSGFFVKARVVDVSPIYETLRVSYPEERCWNERVRHTQQSYRRSYTPAIAGAIIGGVAGNQFSRGRKRDVLTVAGALLGASVGRDFTRPSGRTSYLTTERRCEVVDRVEEQEQLVGYDVSYRYNGRIFSTQTDAHPGKFIRVKVQVEPTQDYAYNRYQGDDGWDD